MLIPFRVPLFSFSRALGNQRSPKCTHSWPRSRSLYRQPLSPVWSIRSLLVFYVLANEHNGNSRLFSSALPYTLYALPASTRMSNICAGGLLAAVHSATQNFNGDFISRAAGWSSVLPPLCYVYLFLGDAITSHLIFVFGDHLSYFLLLGTWIRYT